jgi:serine/threonine-protein kinase
MDGVAQLTSALTGRYEIDREIGSGGMATVYLARDDRHDRRVALKVLNQELGAVLGVERFLAEIRVTANLQHPNLLPLFDSGEAGGFLFYVMPYIEGESLRARLVREKQLPINEAIRLTIAIASAIDYAHRHGVIHRDLKPENILLHEGQPVVADFGIALAVSKAGGNRITQSGLSLGTPQYMSPEQATGDRAIDGRTDIYSLGAILYEMLAGDPPLTGSTAQAIIAKLVIERPRPVTVLRPAVPPHVDAGISLALEKLPADRWGTAHEFADALAGRVDGITYGRGLPAATGVTPLRRRLRDPITLALAGAAIVATATAVVLARPGESEPQQPLEYLQRFADREGVAGTPRPLALSPDGRSMVYVGAAAAGRMLYLRRAEHAKPQPIPGTTGGGQPFFSPDGKWVGFSTGAKLMKVALDGGPPVEIAEAPADHAIGAASWFPNGLILVNLVGRNSGFTGLWSVPGTGGTLKLVSEPDTLKGELARVQALLHADGRTMLFISIPKKDRFKGAHLAVASVDGGPVTDLGLPAVYPLGFVDDQVVYVRPDGAVLAVRFNARSRRVEGSPLPLLDGITLNNAGVPEAALSRSGTLAYTAGGSDQTLSWVDEHGVARQAAPEVFRFSVPRVSPDGKRIAVWRREADGTGGGDVWIYELATSTWTRLTHDTSGYYPEWSPDSRTIYFTRGRDSSYALWRQPVDGSRPPEHLFHQRDLDGYIVMRDGSIVYNASPPKGTPHLFIRALDGDTTPRRVAGFEGGEWSPRLSPNGKFLAYLSEESGADQIYVRPFPGPGPRLQVSSESGSTEPVWSPDGQRLYFRVGDVFYAATIAFTPSLAVTSRVRLFQGPYDEEWDVPNYDVAPDGKQLLMVRLSSDQRQVVVVVNWSQTLRARLAASK